MMPPGWESTSCCTHCVATETAPAHFETNADMTVRILQLTDLHLFADPAARLREIPTRAIVQRVLAAVQARAGEWDLVVLTGDLAHDETRETYSAVRDLLGPQLLGLQLPGTELRSRGRCRIVPGNHDNRAAIRDAFPDCDITPGEWITFATDVGGWRLIGLDTHCPGEVWGRIEPSQLDWLATELEAHSDRRTLIFMHHPPFQVQSRWLDLVGLRQAEAFWEVIRHFPHVRGVSCGHVHQEFRGQVHGVAVYTTPAASIQFRPGTDELEITDEPPGFRVFALDGDTCESQVWRVAGGDS